MELVDVVRKLVGPIDPVGETHTDAERFKNILAMTVLVDMLLGDLNDVSRHLISHEHSKNKAGKYARDFLKNISREYWE